ncbi:MAG: hypothetical protein ACLFQA_05780 [Bacteroidales bacterium]
MLTIKKIKLQILALAILGVIKLPLSGQEDDRLQTSKNKEIYSRVRYGIIPALAYDSDLGFRYGAVINIFDYGRDQGNYGYDQHLFLRGTNTSTGSLQLQGLLESNSLIANSLTHIEASYLSEKKYDFYGFNGSNSVYNFLLVDKSSPLFRSRFFYSYERNLLRLRLDNQLRIGDGDFRLLTGVMLNKYEITPAINPESRKSDAPSEDETLFANYIDWGLISEDEKSGGIINLFSLGLIYDTRNDLCYCREGKWIEAVFLYSPSFLSDNHFARLVFTYRHHTSTMNDNLTISFRASSQQSLSGKTPFYLLSTYYDSRLNQDGIGGAFSLRGANRNRIVADGFLTSNIETKLKIMEFDLLGQDFFISTSLFYDNAFVTQSYEMDQKSVPRDVRNSFFNDNRHKLHHTGGAGAYIVFNKDNVISINYGIPFSRRDGHGGLYVGSSLLF